MVHNEPMPTPFSPDHMWRTPDGNYLVQGALERLPHEVTLPRDIEFAAKYYLVTSAATISRVYSHPIPYAIDDDQGYCNIHVMIDADLCDFHWIDNYYHGVTLKTRIILTGLQRVIPEELPFDLKTLEKAIKERRD